MLWPNTMLHFANEVGHQIKSGIYLINFIIKSIRERGRMRERLRLAHAKRIRHEQKAPTFAATITYNIDRFTHKLRILMAYLCTNKVVVNHFHGTLFLKTPNNIGHNIIFILHHPIYVIHNFRLVNYKNIKPIFMGTQY